MDEQIAQYIVNLVQATRKPDSCSSSLKGLVRYGASPRASLFLAMASRANAFLNGRGYVTPQDVKEVAMDTLRHRIILTYEAEAEEKSAEDIVQKILDSVKVP
jgi:MoxR-like ATPase